MIRTSSHAGSWYSSNPSNLASTLTSLLSSCNPHITTTTRALIVPHAGYSYSASTASHAYSSLNPSQITRIFIFGPSHHIYIKGCALSPCTSYSTPLGPITLDTQTIKALQSSGQFSTLALDADEAEHSIEMQLPFIAHIMQQKAFSIIPILVGELSSPFESFYSKIFAPYLDDPTTLFIVSSDFCHWGNRFRYNYTIPDTPIYSSIETLDRTAMRIISTLSSSAFKLYLAETKNTICGRNPILLLLLTIEEMKKTKDTSVSISFLHYEQSSKVTSPSDSSVSYAAAKVEFE